MKKILSILTIFTSTLSIAQNWEWAKLNTPADASSGMNIMTGPDGKVYGAGNFHLSLSLTNSVTLGGLHPAFVAKFDTAGLCQWAQQINVTNGCGCTNGSAGAKVVGFDSGGNIIVAGFYCGCSADFGNGVTTTDWDYVMYVAKFNSSGQCQWAKTKPSTNSDILFDVTIDAQDNIYMSFDNFANGVTFCGLSFNSGAYVIKINSSGNGIWKKLTGTTTGYGITSLKYDKNRLYCSGAFGGTATIGTNTYTASGSNDAFVAVMDTAGTILKSSRLNAAGNESPSGLCMIGNTKFCFLAQTTGSSVTVGSYTVNTGTGKDKSFLISYDTALNVINARTTATDSLGQGNQIYSDKFGHIYVLAGNYGTTGFGNLTSVPAGSHIISMDYNLHNYWRLESVNGCVAPDTLGNIYIVDIFTTSQTYGSTTLSATNGITLGKIRNAFSGLGGRMAQNNSISVYPNPSEGLFNLRMGTIIKHKQSINISLWDINGKLIENVPFTQVDDFTLQVNLESYAKGLYMIKAQIDGVFYSAKLEK